MFSVWRGDLRICVYKYEARGVGEGVGAGLDSIEWNDRSGVAGLEIVYFSSE